MLNIILSVIVFVLLAVDFVLLFQFIHCLKLHRKEPLEAYSGYLIRRLNAIMINGFMIAAIRIAMIFLR